jgi:hypothetical protein
MWRRERVDFVGGCGGVAGCAMAGVAMAGGAVGLIEDVGWLDPAAGQDTKT